MLNTPRIRIELEGVKHQIVHHFSSYNDEVEKAIEGQLETAIRNFPFEETVLQLSRAVISDAIKDALEFYFKYGDGRAVIQKAVTDKLNELYG